MKTKIPALLILSLIFLISGCSTSPSMVPSLSADSYPHVKFSYLDPRSVSIHVKDIRSINKKAHNTAAVEARVKETLAHALERDGVKVKRKSENVLKLILSDYTGKNAKGQCVKINGHLVLSNGATVTTEAFACHGIKIGVSLDGNISQSYKDALRMTLKDMDKKLTELKTDYE